MKETESHIVSPESKETLEDRYFSDLRRYDDIYKEMKRRQIRASQGAIDAKSINETLFFERERHDIHLDLLALGEKIGKTKADVLADIMRFRGSLEEYGLPEFPVIQGGELTHPHFRIDVKTLDALPPWQADMELRERMREIKKQFGDGMEGASAEYREREKTIEHSSVIVFAAMPFLHFGNPQEEGGVILPPKDIALRESRAKALAEQEQLEYFDGNDEDYHAAEMKILGVIVPNERIEQVAAVIRHQDVKYRLGEKYYSKKEMILAERKFNEKKGRLNKWMSEEKKARYWKEWHDLYGEE
jgi:hypothetical protein